MNLNTDICSGEAFYIDVFECINWVSVYSERRSHTTYPNYTKQRQTFNLHYKRKHKQIVRHN